MNVQNPQNLDRICAEYGYQICQSVLGQFNKKSDTENLITKSLSVLQEDGVYAFFLYLASQIKDKGEKEKTSSKAARVLADKATTLLSTDHLALFPQDTQGVHEKGMEYIRKEGGLADNLDQLLLAKRVLEQTLIYARYHAKALKG
jgi:hypothetical protein